jgi:hypothetical protein
MYGVHKGGSESRSGPAVLSTKMVEMSKIKVSWAPGVTSKMKHLDLVQPKLLVARWCNIRVAMRNGQCCNPYRSCCAPIITLEIRMKL